LRALWADFRPNCVVHLAAQAGVRHSLDHPRAYIAANLDGFLGVLEACRAHPVRHLIYASSSSVYGANTKVPFHEDDPVLAPVSLYGATKRANELMAQTYAHLYGIACSGVRFFTVYGPWGRPDMAYYAFTKAILEGRPIDVFNHGRMQRDFTYVDDIVEGTLRVLARPAPYAIFNIGNHAPIGLLDYIAALERALGRKAKLEMKPMQPGDVKATYADTTELRRAVGFAPSTPLETGLARFAQWFKSYYGYA
jgi:UDP-glucuronate 4-epimerase